MHIGIKLKPGAARLLVIETDVAARARMQRLLEQNGFIVETAASDPEAVGKLGAGAIDLVLVEFLPSAREDRIEMCRRLTHSRGAPAVIFFGARCNALDRIEVLEAGADDFLEKHCNPRELIARVNTVLRRRSPGS